jgi:hypothetical protein
MADDRRVADAAGCLERRAARRAAACKHTLRVEGEAADGVVMAPLRLICGKRRAAKEPAVLAVPAVDRTKRVEPEAPARVAALVDHPALAAPLLEGYARLVRQQVGSSQPLGVGKGIRIGPDKHHVRGSFHDPPSHGDRVQMVTQAGDAPAAPRRKHDAAIEAHPTRGVGEPAEPDAVDVRGPIGVGASRFHGVK